MQLKALPAWIGVLRRSRLSIVGASLTTIASVSSALCSLDSFAQCPGPILDEASFGSPASRGFIDSTTLDPDGVGPAMRSLVLLQDRILWLSLGNTWRMLGGAPVSSITSWDPDGHGPLPERLVGGALLNYGWNNWGSALYDLSTNVPTHISKPFGEIIDLSAWDPTGGDGPRSELIALAYEGNLPDRGQRFVYRKVGTTWQKMGSSLYLTGLRVLDVDGLGPMPAQLYAFGSGVYRWDGANWLLLGASFDDAIYDMIVWDRDGSGPIVPYIVIAGDFTQTLSGQQIKRIAKWNGTSWSSVSAGSNHRVTALAVARQPENPGAESLHVFGTFNTIGGVAANRAAAFDGLVWRALGDGLGSAPERCVVRDPYGALDAQSQIITEKGVWNGTQWSDRYTWDENLNAWINGSAVPEFNYLQKPMTPWDPDGSGPAHSALAVIDPLDHNHEFVCRILQWNGLEWIPLPVPMGDITSSYIEFEEMVSHDVDGDGPTPPWLVYSGQFDITGSTGALMRNIGAWQGDKFTAIGHGLMRSVYSASNGWGTVRALLSHDPDAEGPSTPVLYAAGDFDRSAAATSLPGIAAWFDGAWHPLDQGVSGSVARLFTWDIDGAGPANPVVIASGTFTPVGYAHIADIALWNGMSWQPFPGPHPTAGYKVIGMWDQDGPGPMPAQPVAGKLGYESAPLEVWDGTHWKIHTFTRTSMWGLRTGSQWDPDGSGPKTPTFVVSGYSGSELVPVAPYEQKVQPLVGYWYYDEYWDDWEDASNLVALTTIDVDGEGPVPPVLVCRGSIEEYRYANGAIHRGKALARFMDGPPQFLRQPSRLPSNSDTRTVGLEVVAIGSGNYTYRWSRDGVPLNPGPTTDGSVISSVDTPVLIISGATIADNGMYTCMITNACGSTLSDPFALAVTFDDICIADYNNDTIVDILDLLDFISDLSDCESMPSPCGTFGSPDITGDTMIDILDFLEFMDAFASGC